MRSPRFLKATLLGVVVAAMGLTSVPAAQAATAGAPSSHVHVCGPAAHGAAACDAIRNDAAPHVGRAVVASPSGYHPADLAKAYNLPSATAGSGRTIAIVDAYDDPSAEADLGVYRSKFLPATPCTTANGCFRKVNQSGGTTPPKANGGWAQEISLDLDMASAICPNCKILLVEANSSSMANLGAAVNTAAGTPGVTAISNSYGGSESNSESSNYDPYYTHPGIAITASSGDGGYGVEYPAASQYVTAVGGTTMHFDGTTFTESAWSGAGSGCSNYEPQIVGQPAATGCPGRAVADVSAVADPNTGVSVYDSYRYQGMAGWLVFGGTSVASPIIAGVYALAAGNSTPVAPSALYTAPAGSLRDVQGGSNGTCSVVAQCNGVQGWDGPTGLGTPNGIGAF